MLHEGKTADLAVYEIDHSGCDAERKTQAADGYLSPIYASQHHMRLFCSWARRIQFWFIVQTYLKMFYQKRWRKYRIVGSVHMPKWLVYIESKQGLYFLLGVQINQLFNNNIFVSNWFIKRSRNTFLKPFFTFMIN